MTTTPEGLTITGPEDVFTHADIHRFLRGRKQRLYPEVSRATTVVVTGDDVPSITNTNVSRYGSEVVVTTTIRLSTHPNRTFRDRPWTIALHEWGHAVGNYHLLTTHRLESWRAYEERRGLLNLPLGVLGSSYRWTVGELFADDFRLTFANAAGRAERVGHLNRELPPLDVVAWRGWFNRTWRGLG
jgi:hypothetical protein